MNRAPQILLTIALAAALPAAATAAPPVAVSPGAPDAVGRVATACPTFSWTYDPEATAVDLAVYRLDSAETGAAPEEAPPAVAARLPSGAVSWTPDSEECLEPGERYAWFVRSESDGLAGPWSEGNLFEVAAPLAGVSSAGAEGGRDSQEQEPGTRQAREPLARPVAVAAARPAVVAAPAVPASLLPERADPTPRFPISFSVDESMAVGGRYFFSEPVEIDYFVPASAFQLRRSDEEDGWELKDDYGFVTRVSGEAGDIHLVAALPDLPAPATLRTFHCHAQDNVELDEAPGEPDIEDLFFHMDLVGDALLSTDPGDVVATAELLTDGASTVIQSNASPVFDTPLSVLHAHRIEGLYRAESQGGNLRFYGCTIGLAITRLDPR